MSAYGNWTPSKQVKVLKDRSLFNGGKATKMKKILAQKLWPSLNLSSKSSGPPHQTGSRQNM